MGTEFEAVLVGPDADYLRDAAAQALDEVERLDERLSHYRADSEITDLNLRAAHEPVRLEPSLFALLARAVALCAATDGAFDCTAGPLVRCWGFFRGEGSMPSEDALRAARERVGSGLLQLDRENYTVRFAREGVQVHLGAFGKGYAVDVVVETLRQLRVEAALIHAGTSTVYALGAPPGAEGWDVGLRDPRDPERRLGVVSLRDRALSTSGDYEQFFEVDGRRYSHVLDPRTGFPAAGMASATVLGENAADTDALSTAAFVLGESGARRLWERFPGIGVVLV
ncbi:MAG TPA: FAD:protein FMN transferase, partial [Armatimonadota bacterium]|nr:FAD:protein FMN transferase [Armatimonadota bacterium]